MLIRENDRVGALQRPPSATKPPTRQPAPLRALRIAVTTAFGLPFLYCLDRALRGELFVGHYRFFGDASSLGTLTAWTVVSALGSLWLGLCLQLGPVPWVAQRTRHALATALILAGITALLFSARLLGLRAAA